MNRPPDLDTLVSVHAVKSLGHLLRADEQSVRDLLERIEHAPIRGDARFAGIALTYEDRRRLRKGLTSHVVLAALASSSVIYAVDYQALREASNGGGAGRIDLPPLPFPRVVFEADEPHPWPLKRADTGETVLRVEAVFVEEREQGARWEGMVFFQVPGINIAGDDERLAVLHRLLFEVTPDGVSWKGAATDSRSHDDPVRRMIVEGVHYIVARGVTLTLVKSSRQVQRAEKRKGVLLPERVYWVRVVDEHQRAVGGAGDREFHCRWLVRGHWRRIAENRKTWIRPYIKGPAGAPWRGRPVYHVAGRAA